MKKFSKILSVALLVALVLSLGVANAFADVNITITRDDSYQTGATGTRTYTYYQVFRATTGANGATSTGGGVNDATGAPGTVTTTAETGISYYLLKNDTNVGKFDLGTNLWFDLTKSADETRYYVSWKENAGKTADDIQAAAAWIIDNEAYIASDTVSADGDTWTAEVAEGYYVIEGSEGKNLVAATTDISIAEKNSYPTIDKQEKDDDQSNMDATKGLNTRDANNNGTQDASKVAVGDKIDYQVTVHVPADANMPIVVTDTMSSGLQFNDDVAITVGGTALPVGATYITAANKGDSDTWTWKYTIDATSETKGKDIVFTFTGTVTAAALVDSTKENDVELKYNNEHYVVPDFVEYETYFTGIKKTANSAAGDPLEGVTFTLKENGTPFHVRPVMSEAAEGEEAVVLYYVACASTDTGATTSVVTDASGLIKIRGLDGDKEYTLTETATLPGYNPLDEDVTLALTKDEGDAFEKAGTNTNGAAQWGSVINKSGTVLPSTGGIGTTIFYVVGGVLVLAAIILLVTKKRMSE